MFALQGMGTETLRSGTVATDWEAVGLLAAIIGSLLFANAILFRHPRALVEEHFGGAPRRLVSLRGYTFRRINIHLGLLLLIAGFGLQLFGRLSPPAEPGFPWAWLVALLVGIGVLELVAWGAAQRMFLRYLKKHLRAHPEVLDGDAGLARELGGLLGLASSPEDSVSSYVARLKSLLGAPAGPGETLDPSPRRARHTPLGFPPDDIGDGSALEEGAEAALLGADHDELG